SSRLATVPPIVPSPTNPSVAKRASFLPIQLGELLLDAQDVLGHRLPRSLCIFRGDRLCNQPVLGDRTLRPARELEDRPEHLGQAARLQHSQRLAHRGAADAVALGELALGGEGVARLERGADLGAQALADLLVDLTPLDRGKRLGHWSDSMTGSASRT